MDDMTGAMLCSRFVRRRSAMPASPVGAAAALVPAAAIAERGAARPMTGVGL